MNASKLLQPQMGKILATLLLSIGLSGCSGGAEETRQVSAEHIAGTAIQVTAANGSISVSQANIDSVEISAELSADSAKRLAQAELIVERVGDNTLDVRVQWPEQKLLSGDAASFTVKLPDASGVNLRSTNGKLSLSGLAGAAVLNTSNAGISAEDHNGSVMANTANGPITLDAISGAIEAHTTNGKIKVTDAASAVNARGINGGIEIELTSNNSSAVNASTVNGSIKIQPGKVLSGEWILSNVNGEISFEHPPEATLLAMEKHLLHLAFDGSGQSSRLNTVNGKIQVD